MICAEKVCSYAKWPDATANCAAKGKRLPALYETSAYASGGKGALNACMNGGGFQYTWTSTGTTNAHYLWSGTSATNDYGPEGFGDTWANLPYYCVKSN